MRAKILFFLLVVFIFTTQFYLGYIFFDTDRTVFHLVEGLTIISVILFVVIYRILIKPYQILIESIDMLKGQDFASRLRPVANKEANKLIAVFNRMITQLKEERLSVREKNYFLDLLINASPQGVLILNFDYKLTSANPAALRFIGVENSKVIKDKKLSEIDNRICQSLANLQPGNDKIIRGIGVSQYRCSLLSFIDRGFSHPFILIEELTHELLAIEKKSYENVIRMMSHEVNNSAGAINATLEVLSDIAKDDIKLKELLPALDASLERNMHLATFISRLADVVKIPQPNKTKVNISELIKTVGNLVYSECNKRNIKIEIILENDKDYFVYIDGIQFEHLLLNVVKNAYEAIEKDGIIRIQTVSNPFVLSIKNNGPELSEMDLQNLFTPFYTTKSKGQGVGLMFVREVLVNHNFKFDFYTQKGWTSFDIYVE